MEELKQVETKISNILLDTLLIDIPKDITLEEVEKLVALEKGQAFILTIERPGLKDIWLSVSSNTTIAEVKKLFQIQINRILKESGQKVTISWKHIWRSNYLAIKSDNQNSSQVLEPETAKLQDFQIFSSATLKFIPRVFHGKRKTKF
ncbi:U11/U12 small nuclear ribonucleoprotein [Entomophthora muscae]|uniref:U11/U12 small nuclear ribonucleoprotein n=1 Tax=Entomophthora muscae TaxID=34485 RepID=A0ACC2UMR9_9FUNG|nr:U11/U12 small nuclear ribonucleoprotein [Entomophthora muscae]